MPTAAPGSAPGESAITGQLSAASGWIAAEFPAWIPPTAVKLPPANSHPLASAMDRTVPLALGSQGVGVPVAGLTAPRRLRGAPPRLPNTPPA